MGLGSPQHTPTFSEAMKARGWTDDDVKRRLRNSLARLRYARTVQQPHQDYILRGGPFDGYEVALTSGYTAPFLVGSVAGRYVPAYLKEHSTVAQQPGLPALFWLPAEAERTRR